MRIAQVSGNSGPGIVAQIHSARSIAALEAFLTERGIEGRAIAAPSSWVEPGIQYEGSAFVQPTAPSTPAPTPPTVEQVRSELDTLRSDALREYVAQWGEVSKQELWPQLDGEMQKAATETEQGLDPAQYPAIQGFLIASGIATPTGTEVFQTAATLRGHKQAHVQMLRATERVRAVLIAKFEGLNEPEKLAWDSATEWGASYGA